MKEKYSFVYLWYDSGKSRVRENKIQKKRYYIGYHWGHENDGYICSSSWLRKAFKKRPQDFSRRILSKHKTKEEGTLEEYRLLRKIKPEELGQKYYNLTTIFFPDSDEFRKKKSQTQGVWNKDKSNPKAKGTKFYNNGAYQGMFFPGQEPEGWILGRIGASGENNPFFGKTHSVEKWNEIKSKLKGRTVWNKGKKGIYSQETIEKMKVGLNQRWKNN